ncbi:MAG: BatD family protein, partial [candidate division Zixibacteria bacterium]|nr:BatD family protein [candidate division Zixibacteria bacterium]
RLVMCKKWFVALMFFLSALAVAQGDIQIQISMDRDTINVNEQAYLTVTILTGQQNLPAPELPNLSMFNVYSQGTSTSISIVNGKMESSFSYQYLLQPKKQGTFLIRPVTIVYNQKRYASNEFTLTVLDSGVGTPKSLKQEAITRSGESREMFLTAEVDKKTVYVNEQVTLTIKYFYAIQLYSQPEYTAPQTTDFWTDVLEPQKSYYQIIDGQRYNVIEITSALFPTRSGELTIGQAMVTATIPVRKAQPRRNDPFAAFDNFFTQGEPKSVNAHPIIIKVLPLPADNKPASFSGTVGNYTINATVDKTNVDINQPVTVTYKINGTGNIKTVAEPNIGELDDFRIYRASTDEKISRLNGVIGGTKIFEEVYISRRAGRLAIPSVKIDFFNPTSRKYQTVSTNSIMLEVHPTQGSDYAETPLRAVPGGIVEPTARDIRYIKTDPGSFSRGWSIVILSPFYLIINALPVLLLMAVWISKMRKEKLFSDIGYARSRAAKRLARKRLSTARKLANVNQTTKFYAEIRQAIFSYVADKLNISPFGLTSERLFEIFKETGVDITLIEKTRELIKRADFAQYSSANAPQEQIAESLQMAEELLIILEGIKIG